MKSIMGETGERRRPGMNDSRSYYKSQHSIMAKDQADLKNQIEELKRENLGLKKSLFDLSMRHEAALAQLEASSRHAFDMGAIVGSGGAPGGAPGRADEPVPVGRGAFREPSQETPSWSEKERRAVDERAGSRQFGWDYDLKGHTGAVYAVRWSPCGSFLASGSFDKTVRVWSVSGEVQRELLCLNEHQLNVSDVEWSADSQRLVSSSFDQTVKEWDVKGAALLRSHDVGGLGQCVAYDPGDEQLIYVGTTHKQVQIIDRRQPDLQNALLKNESIVNTVAVQAAGRVLISGDQEGYLKTWDLRTLGCVHQRHNDEQHKPISHIEVCHPRHAMRPSADGRDRDDLALGEHGRYLGVNSYDNVMRVYDRWCAAGPLRSAAAAAAAAESEAAAADGETSPQKMGPGGGTGMAGQQHGVAMGAPGMGGRSNVIATPPRRGTDRGSGNDSGEGTSPPQHDGVGEGVQGLRTSPKLDRGGMNGGGGGERGNSGSSGHDSVTHGLMCTMKGHKNKNWPIRSSFFHGENCSNYYRTAAGRGNYEKSRDTMMTGGLNKAGKPGGLNLRLNAFDEEDVDQSAAAEDEIRHAQQKQGVHESFLMATGSADHHVYIYDVGDAVARNWSGVAAVAPLLQQMPGHTDRVYAVDFHPTEAVLASCSADFTVKLWAPRADRTVMRA